jgi:mannose-1-phosphate guanylyltransferase
MNVMLLAAGEGVRLRPYTLMRPKPAIPFLNIPLGAYPLGFLEGMKVDRLIVNTFHLPTKIVDLFIHMNHGARRLHFSHEINQILDTGGGLGFAREYFKNQGDLILMNADEVILPFEKQLLSQAFEYHQKNKALCTIITKDHPGVGTKFGGVWLDHDNKVKGFGKAPPSEDCETAEHYVGVLILSEKILDYLPNGTPSNILYDAVTKGIQEGHLVQRFKINCHWYETGNPTDFLHANQEALNLLTNKADTSYAKNYLQKTLERFSKETPIIESTPTGTILKTPSSVIEPDVSLSGFTVLGSGCRIGKNSQFQNVIVADQVHVAPGTHVQNEVFLANN